MKAAGTKRVTLDQYREITQQNRWASNAASILSDQGRTADAEDHIGTHWIEAGQRIREQTADDRVLERLLRTLLPLMKVKRLSCSVAKTAVGGRAAKLDSHGRQASQRRGCSGMG